MQQIRNKVILSNQVIQEMKAKTIRRRETKRNLQLDVRIFHWFSNKIQIN